MADFEGKNESAEKCIPEQNVFDTENQCVIEYETIKNKGWEIINKQQEAELKTAINTPLQKIEDDLGITVDIDHFLEGITATFEREGAHIGVLAVKIKENPGLVYDIVSKRVKEFAVECANDPVQCVSDIHGKAVDFVYNFFVKTDEENFKNFAYDIGQATGEVFLGISTIGTINVARISYINPELKDPKDYPQYLANKIKPKLYKYLSPESQKQVDIFISLLSENLSLFDLKKLQELFGAMEQFVKDCKNGVLSTVNTIQTLDKLFLDVAYSGASSFDPRPIIRDMIDVAYNKQEKWRADHSDEIKEVEEDLQNKFITAIAKFSVEHETPLINTYFSLKNTNKAIPERETVENALNELIIFRYEYCKDMTDKDFKEMMIYAKDKKIIVNNPKINRILAIR